MVKKWQKHMHSHLKLFQFNPFSTEREEEKVTLKSIYKNVKMW